VRKTILVVASVSAIAAAACCRTPVVAPATNASGLYVRALPGDVRAGVVPAPTSSTLGWPPATPDPAAPCTDEIAAFERSLGVVATACPSIQMASVPAQGNGDAPIGGSGFNLKCYALEKRVLVVEHTETLGATRCTHVVGVALFPRAP
jgi:hypothetical protein